MIAVQGYFEGDRFFPEQPVKIPPRRRAIVTILDEPSNTEEEHERHKKAWLKFLHDIQKCGEPIEGEPERFNIDRELDI